MFYVLPRHESLELTPTEEILQLVFRNLWPVCVSCHTHGCASLLLATGLQLKSNHMPRIHNCQTENFIHIYFRNIRIFTNQTYLVFAQVTQCFSSSRVPTGVIDESSVHAHAVALLGYVYIIPVQPLPKKGRSSRTMGKNRPGM